MKKLTYYVVSLDCFRKEAKKILDDCVEDITNEINKLILERLINSENYENQAVERLLVQRADDLQESHCVKTGIISISNLRRQ